MPSDLFGISDLSGRDEDSSDDDSEEDDAEDMHLVFLSHYKAEAGTEATLVKEHMERILADGNESSDSSANVSCPVFLDSENLTDLGDLRRQVINTKNLLLLLTPAVLSRPWCLVELVTAIRHGIQIVPVEIQRPGMTFEYPKSDDFYHEQLRRLRIADVEKIREEGIEPREILEAMRHVFTQIAVPFSPHKSHGIREAELGDILHRCGTLKKH